MTITQLEIKYHHHKKSANQTKQPNKL